MPSRNRVTMAENTEKSGVSLSTVSLVLRDKWGVGDETRERVQQVARVVGYILKSPTSPSSLAKADVGLILKSEPAHMPWANPFYAPVLTGIEVACRHPQANRLERPESSPVTSTLRPQLVVRASVRQLEAQTEIPAQEEKVLS